MSMQPGMQMDTRFSWSSALRARHVALPAEHGAWIFLFSPLAIGLALGGVTAASLLLVIAILAAFLVRQPLTIYVKVFSGRRSRSELPNALFWLMIYGSLAATAAIGLLVLGFGFILALAVPAIPIFTWHLWLVSRRAERRQIMIEIAASGVLALAAPAAFWVGQGQYYTLGWILWGLAWLQVAGTILYAYMRLEQRQLKSIPGLSERIRMARSAFLYNLAALLLVLALSIIRIVPAWLFLAFLIQPLEVVWGIYRPAVGLKPKHIGIRQLVISIIFTLVFILTWML
jgi:hypothetical protein